MSQRTPCRFYNSPGGCRKGNQCTFAHLPAQRTSTEDARSMSPLSDGEPRAFASRPPLTTMLPPPKGVCRVFWGQGSCSRAFDCHYRHQAGPGMSSGPSRPATPTPPKAKLIDRLAPYLTEQGLSRMNGGGTDGFLAPDSSNSLSPVEAHNFLSRFLFDTYRFHTSLQVYTFVVPLNSANSSNGQWTQEDGQLLLNTMSSQNALLRIIDIIRWPQVSPRAGLSREVLSFQKGMLPLLGYISSDFVIKSTLVSRVNALLAALLQNLPNLADAIENCMPTIMTLGSFTDPLIDTGANGKMIGPRAFASMCGALHECLVRFKNAVVLYPRLAPLIINVHSWFEQWSKAVSASPPGFGNPFDGVDPAVRNLLLSSLKEKVDRLKAIVDRELGKQADLNGTKPVTTTIIRSSEGLIAALHSSYDPPGHLRTDGSRHDNDFVDISEIRVAPTHQELMCRTQPFLPASLYDAPHPAPRESMERLLDIQFRLLREELTAPLRTAIQLVDDDLKVKNRATTQLNSILQKNGGKYNGHVNSHESIMFNVYSDVKFLSIVPDHRGLSVSLTVQAPPGRASSKQGAARATFWQGMSGKRLPQGGLIALVWDTGRGVSVHLGVVANTLQELTDFVRTDSQRVKLRIVFFDSQVELRILQALGNRESASGGVKMLVESPVMFEAVRPFLEALKREPETIPFSKYLAFRPPTFLKQCNIDPPKYARLPGFTFQLGSLFMAGAEVDDLRLDATDERSIEQARAALRNGSRLDPSQADAIVDALTREVALMQGPPGTGKSYTGVELLRVLIANGVRPILMIAFTNHALDHMLSSVLDAKITTNIVRLGSRSSDERISQYSIEIRERVAGQTLLHKTMAHRHREIKQIQQQIMELMERILKTDLDSTEMLKYITLYYPEHLQCLSSPPEWVEVAQTLSSGDAFGGPWQVQGHRGRVINQDTSPYGFWRRSGDFEFLGMVESLPPPSHNARTVPSVLSIPNSFQVLSSGTVGADNSSIADDSEDDDDNDTSPEEHDPEKQWLYLPDEESEEEEDSMESPESIDYPEPVERVPSPDPLSWESCIQDRLGFFQALGEEDIPSIPSGDRDLQVLLVDDDVWGMSATERARLHKYWTDQARIQMSQNHLGEFERLRDRHADKMREYNEGREAARLKLLEKVDIIGCTTTGAAKLTTLLQALCPRVLLVEEAGQVLEAHVLGSLVPSTEHLILIGDPLQLRPTLNNFSLSMDSRRGRDLFRFDMSLMERLSSSGLSMSRLDVQRRMRPSISSLIRNTLYPGLQDHDLVLEYPDVHGMAKNLYFVTHSHKENGGADDTASKYNTYEVEMIHDLVLYLLRQGCYSEEGDIVVLCAYLGQLARLRDALAGEVVAVIDERDQAALADQEAEIESDADSSRFEHVNVTKRVRLRTVDNYQGEEGKIVILSLVRNSGSLDDETEQGLNHSTRPNIGFLKSENRTNVALSRAREGLYIFGNADNLSCKSHMWRSIIEELQATDSVGTGLPICCFRHPEKLVTITQPGQLPQFAPDGGCLEPCNALLKCGHLCPFKCHSDDPNHVSVVCNKNCRRLCYRDHPCAKACNEPCGDCMFPVANVRLPCGHTKDSIPCFMLDMVDSLYCDFMVEKHLPRCEHSAVMQCSQSPEDYPCTVQCAELMSCCGKACKASCHDCQRENNPGLDQQGVVTRTRHVRHPCQKNLYCEHQCQEPCSEGHEHTTRCTQRCRQECPHARCSRPCSTPCAPCKEPCTWTCPHYSCPVPCGSVCARLPCDQRCEMALRCGHRCPSVCGEVCSAQVCPVCANEDRKSQVVDLILQRTMVDVDPDMESLDELLITIPSCGHTFTVETLDGHCAMTEFYTQSPNGRWTGLLSPSGFRRPPTCPTCRSVIRTPRYSRIYKRADLDILERNVAAQMSRHLGDIQNKVEAVALPRSKSLLVGAAANFGLKFSDAAAEKKGLARARDGMLKASKEVPIPFHGINPANKKLHTIHNSVLDVWRGATNELITAYKETVEVAERRSAHAEAWEAAISRLFEHEMEVMQTSSKVAKQPREHAMRLAKIQIGQPRPLADRRFLVEAFWLTIHIRLTLSDLVQTWIQEISKRDSDVLRKTQPKSWATYLDFLFDSCVHDVDIALKVATNSESRRQITKTVLYRMRIELEKFRFHLFMMKTTGLLGDQKKRDELIERVGQYQANHKRSMMGTIQEHRQKKSSTDEVDWLRREFVDIAQDIVKEWGEIQKSLRLDTFYQPMSMQERMQIVKAFNFPTAGHFYNCPNGHTFVITECGGATQQWTCPECGAAIGGSGHRLLSSNTRAPEYDDIAQQLGAQPSFWVRPH